MTIDKALDEIIVDEKNKSAETEERTSMPEKLADDARQIVGEQLVKFFSGQLTGQSPETIEVYETLNPLIREVGMYLFNIIPGKKTSPQRPNHIVCQLFPNQETHIIERIINVTGGEYTNQTDLSSLASGSSPFEDIINTIPELTLLKSIISSTFKEDNRRATINPYIISMGMKVRNRPLAIMAVKEGADEGVIKLLGSDTYVSAFPPNSVSQSINRIRPNSRNYVNVAQHYGVRNIAEVMKEFNEVCNLYLGAWK